MAVVSTIQVKNGLEANLPTLSKGEFGYCTDTKNLYIGGELGNDLINEGGGSGSSYITHISLVPSFSVLTNSAFPLTAPSINQGNLVSVDTSTNTITLSDGATHLINWSFTPYIAAGGATTGYIMAVPSINGTSNNVFMSRVSIDFTNLTSQSATLMGTFALNGANQVRFINRSSSGTTGLTGGNGTITIISTLN